MKNKEQAIAAPAQIFKLDMNRRKTGWVEFVLVETELSTQINGRQVVFS